MANYPTVTESTPSATIILDYIYQALSGGASGNSPVHAEDSAHVSGDYGNFVLAVRNDGLAVLTNADFDYSPISVSSKGQVMVKEESAASILSQLQAWSSTNAVKSVGITKIVNGTFTRPADTNVYAAGDVISDSTSTPSVINFANCSRAAAGSGVINSVQLIDSANQATTLDADLFLFDTSPAIDNDNSPFTPTDAELATCIGIVSFSGSSSKAGDATAGAGGNRFYPNALSGTIDFVTGGGSMNLFGVLVARNAYTPVSGESFTIRLGILQD